MNNEAYNAKLHRYGRIFMVLGILMMFLGPVMIWIVTGVAPNLKMMGLGIIGLALFIPGGLIELATYSPVLGTSATYLAFVTGNLANLKIPCVMNAKEICGTEIGTPEMEIVSTISIAFSSITTVVIMSIGVMLLVPLRPILQNPVLVPAFNWVISALFGALGYKYFKNNWKLVVVPVGIVLILSIFMPTLVSGQIVVMIFLLAITSLLAAFIMFKKNII